MQMPQGAWKKVPANSGGEAIGAGEDCGKVEFPCPV